MSRSESHPMRITHSAPVNGDLKRVHDNARVVNRMTQDNRFSGTADLSEDLDPLMNLDERLP